MSTQIRLYETLAEEDGDLALAAGREELDLGQPLLGHWRAGGGASSSTKSRCMSTTSRAGRWPKPMLASSRERGAASVTGGSRMRLY